MRPLLTFILLPFVLSAFGTPPQSKKIKKAVIVLDAGHGGDDRGTVSLDPPILLEKRLTLFTTLLVRSALEGLGYQTLLTRIKDVTLPLDERVAFSNGVDPTCFVSIHFNSAPSREAEGIEVFIYKDKELPERVLSSERLAQSILKRTTERTGAESRGVKPAVFRVIKDTTCPAVLIEGGFLSHPEEAKKIGQPLYLKKLAAGIAEGIILYLNSEKTTSNMRRQ